MPVFRLFTSQFPPIVSCRQGMLGHLKIPHSDRVQPLCARWRIIPACNLLFAALAAAIGNNSDSLRRKHNGKILWPPKLGLSWITTRILGNIKKGSFQVSGTKLFRDTRLNWCLMTSCVAQQDKELPCCSLWPWIFHQLPKSCEQTAPWH